MHKSDYCIVFHQVMPSQKVNSCVMLQIFLSIAVQEKCVNYICRISATAAKNLESFLRYCYCQTLTFGDLCCASILMSMDGERLHYFMKRLIAYLFTV